MRILEAAFVKSKKNQSGDETGNTPEHRGFLGEDCIYIREDPFTATMSDGIERCSTEQGKQHMTRSCMHYLL